MAERCKDKEVGHTFVCGGTLLCLCVVSPSSTRVALTLVGRDYGSRFFLCRDGGGDQVTARNTFTQHKNDCSVEDL